MTIINKKINICLLTHARPTLFKRAINAINKNLAGLNTLQRMHLNFIILCDDKSVSKRDVKLLNSDNVTFIETEVATDISVSYTKLYAESLKISEDAFTYFHEDDDFIFDGVLKLLLSATLSNDADNYMFNYKHGYGKSWDKSAVNRFSFLKYNNFDNKTFDIDVFLKKYDPEHYQLGMLLLSNKSFNIKNFPKGNILQNDYIILKKLKGTIKCSSTPIYQQGFFVEGGNISNLLEDHKNFLSLNKYAL